MPSDNPTWRFRKPKPVLVHPARDMPHYTLPVGLLAQVALAALRHRRRDAWADALRAVAAMHPQPVVSGLEHVPRSGPCVILPNHYERPDGCWVGWGAIAISAALALHRPQTPPIRWVMTTTWADCYIGPRRISPERLNGILRGFASAYGLILMPAHDMPTHTAERLQSGLAVREIFRGLADPRGQVIAFHPEAGGFETMITPPPGAGRLLIQLARQRVPMIPTGVFEEGRYLTVRFGPALPAELLTTPGLEDAEAADRVMLAIARLVPPEVRGVYRERALAAAPAAPAAG